MTLLKSLLKKVIIILIPVLIIAVILLIGHINKITSKEYRLFKPIITSTKLEHSNCDYQINKYTEMDMYKCEFVITSDDTEIIDDELKNIYDEANMLLKSQDIEIPIEITVSAEMFAHGASCLVVLFTNCDNDISIDRTVNDHISGIHAYGITEEMKMYNENFNYEINNKEYWDYFSEAEKLELL